MANGLLMAGQMHYSICDIIWNDVFSHRKAFLHCCSNVITLACQKYFEISLIDCDRKVEMQISAGEYRTLIEFAEQQFVLGR